ncbi:MAG TPA: hypothetical protein VN081_04510 [Dongiaceae bacterium]|nr:hypothetical protein [Dongiaceae bacterium]
MDAFFASDPYIPFEDNPMAVEVKVVEDPHPRVIDRDTLAEVKEQPGEAYPFKVVSKKSGNQLAAFTQQCHADSFIALVAYDVLNR